MDESPLTSKSFRIKTFEFNSVCLLSLESIYELIILRALGLPNLICPVRGYAFGGAGGIYT